MINNNCTDTCEIFDCLLNRIKEQNKINKSDNLLLENVIKLKFKKNENIFKQGNIFTHIINICKGKIKICHENESGKITILSIKKENSIIGSEFVFKNDICNYSIIAIENCEVYLIDINSLKLLTQNNNELSDYIQKQVVTKLEKITQFYVNRANKQVIGRIADVLIFLSENIFNSLSFTLPLSRKELSEFAWCSQENIIKTLSKFDKEGIIKTEGKKIEIINMGTLMRISKYG